MNQENFRYSNTPPYENYHYSNAPPYENYQRAGASPYENYQLPGIPPNENYHRPGARPVELHVTPLQKPRKKPGPRRNAVRRLLLLVILLFCLGAGLAVSVVSLQHLVVYQYSATTEVYIVRSQDASAGGSFYQELMGSIELAKDFQAFVLSESAFVQLRTKLTDQVPWLADHVYKGTRHFIEARGSGQSRIISVTVTCDDPNDAALLANECCELMRTMSQRVYAEDYVQVLKVGQANPQPVSPKRFVVLMAGLFAGLAMGFFICLLLSARWKRVTLRKLVRGAWQSEGGKKERAGRGKNGTAQGSTDKYLPVDGVAAAGGG